MGSMYVSMLIRTLEEQIGWHIEQILSPLLLRKPLFAPAVAP
jgi:hypothetical protein